jgi:hypothetical protein
VPAKPEAIANIPGASVVTFRPTIEARAEQCGTFQNTARAEGLVFPEELPEAEPPFAVAATEQITVQGCGGTAPGQQRQPGGAAPITQESEQESESGEIDQTFEVS